MGQSLKPRPTLKPSHGGTATTATPAPTGTGGDTPTAHTTTGEVTVATCGRGTPRLSLRPMLRPTPRLTGKETGTAGGGEAGDTDTGRMATDTTAAGGGGRSIIHLTA